VKKQKCGGFPNKRCDGVEQAKSPQKLTPPPPPAPEVKTDVLVLSATTLDDAIVDHDIIMVMFFAPWCGSCKALEALYVEAAARLLASGRNAKLAKIDATKETAAAADYGVKAYPTLRLFRDGNMLSTYDGERSADAFVTYMVAEAEAEAPAADDPGPFRIGNVII
jgi:protein disulfide-isomerase-like protein